MPSKKIDPSSHRGVHTSSSDSSGLTFPVGLVQPQPPQFALYADAIGDRIEKLDGRAQAFGISFTIFVLNEPLAFKGETALAVVGTVLLAFAHREERISVERRSGRWGLYFTRSPAVLDQDRKTEAMLLRDAPLDVRERFLQRSEDFFRQYLKLCEDRFSRMKASVASGDHTIKLLEELSIV
jgi:hypothetical protein